jgi:glucosamine-6-phosphate deaminase
LKVKVFDDSKQLGNAAATYCADIINRAICEKGSARLLLSTGASQFDTLSALILKDVDWSKVDMFHLDEYIGIPETHIASFRKYLKERFIGKINLHSANLINGEGDAGKTVKEMSDLISFAPIDLGVVGIGENGHIAFNDPPADFSTEDPYIIVNLDDDCKRQQVREGWFADLASVPAQAISMSPKQIMKCKVIVSCVPHSVKAKAIRNTLENNTTPMIPATLLKEHADITLFLDRESASLTPESVLNRYK